MKSKKATLYDSHIMELTQLFQTSKDKDNPAYWLYRNKARTPLFMVESLTRLLSRAADDPFAKKWNKFFKKLEDALGEIDYYDVFIKQFSVNPSVKKSQINYLVKKLEKVLAKFNKKLKREDFYIPPLKEFSAKNKTDFKNKSLLINLHEQIKSEILLSAEFFNKHPNGFSDFENDVHAMRRKLRWISIYGLSLDGIIVLKNQKHKYKWEKEFVTKTELGSKFNKLPVKKGLNYYIPLNKKAFFALSHVISKLGIIKDKGLALGALSNALEKTADARIKKPKQRAAEQLKLKETEGLLLKEAYDLLYKFFITHKIHIKLLTS